MNVNLAAPATPATRVRLVYRISAGALVGEDGARTAARKIGEAWLSPGVPAFRVTEPTVPVQAENVGTPGLLGFTIAAVAGRREWYTALDVRTNYALPSSTWQSLLSPLESIPLGLLGFDASARLDHVETVTGATAATPAAQAGAASRTAAEPPDTTDVWGDLKRALGWLVLLGLVVLAVWFVRSKR